MKRIFTSPHLWECDQLRMHLSSANIAAEMRNEFGQSIGLGGMIGGAAGFVWPEVWVRDEDYEKAADVLRIRKAKIESSTSANVPPWKCPMCGESIEGEMAVCWNCETEKPMPELVP